MRFQWFSSFGGGSAVPGGANLQIQYNNNGAFGGIPGATWNGTTLALPNIDVGGGAFTVNQFGATAFAFGSAAAMITGFQTISGGFYGFTASAGNTGGASDTALSRNGIGIAEINNGTLGTFAALKVSDLFTNDTSFLIRAGIALTNAAAAATATLTNAPVAGNPTKWISIDDAGTTRRIPAW